MLVLLHGLIFSPTDCAMTPTHTRRRSRLYHYDISMDVIRRGLATCPVRRVPAGEIKAVVDQVQALARTPEIVVREWRAARVEDGATSENDVLEVLQRLDPVWEELFPAEHARILQLLVKRVDVSLDGINIRLRTNGLARLVANLRGRDLEQMAAA
jgi:site-specific DNA recombinase